jgi:hypothetical protein
MEKETVSIVNNQIIVKTDSKIGWGVQQNFCIDIDKIIIASITTKMIFDDDHLFITFIDINGNDYHIDFYYCSSEFISFLDKRFDYSSSGVQNKYDKSIIFYPKDLKNEELYMKWNANIYTILDSFLRALRIKNVAGGILRKEIQNFLLLRRSL